MKSPFRKAPPRPQEAGAVVIVVAVALLTLAGITAIALDGGLAYSERRSSQNAADNAALAGAWAACNGRDPAAAAVTSAELNGFADEQVDVDVKTPETGPNGAPVRRVIVDIKSGVGTTFGRTQGITEIGVASRAEAACIVNSGAADSRVGLFIGGTCNTAIDNATTVDGLFYSAAATTTINNNHSTFGPGVFLGNLVMNNSAEVGFNAAGPGHRVEVGGRLSMSNSATIHGPARVRGPVSMENSAEIAGYLEAGGNFSTSNAPSVNGVHSNGRLLINGGSNTLSQIPNATYSTPPSPAPRSGWSFEQVPASELPPVEPIEMDAFNVIDYAPGGSAAAVADSRDEYFYYDEPNVSFSNNTILDRGLHFFEGNVTFRNRVDGTAGVTIVARGSITFQNHGKYEPYIDNLQAMTTAGGGDCNSTVLTAENNTSLNGTLYAPNGRISLSNGGSLRGAVIGLGVRLENAFAILGDDIPWGEAPVPEVLLLS